MKALQVKYCYSEEEANEFLKTLSVDGLTCPRLHAIQYCPKASVSGNNDSIEGQCNVVAIIQYFVEVK